MEKDKNYTIHLIYSGALSIAICIIYFSFVYIHDGAKIVFCNVGQGDAIYIRTMAKKDILIDAGRDKRVLECLSKYMPLYDRTIEMAFLSHTDADHYGGYLNVLKRYTVRTFVKNASMSDSLFQKFESLIKAQTTVISLYQGDIAVLDRARFYIVWPPKDMVEKKRYQLTNEISQIMIFDEGKIRVLLTGDIDPASTTHLLSSCQWCHQLYGDVPILKVPHHGAANGLTSQLLQTIHPELSIISVGKNSYGHPSSSILSLFRTLDSRYLRTDEEGDIVIRYDLDRWWRD